MDPARRSADPTSPPEYPSVAVSLTHPARLRTWASLHGLGSWTGEPFRMLELGCGNAANLLPLAAQFPRARFVGVDRDAALVARARRDAEAAGLGNVEIVEADLRSYAPGDEPFDFVVAHGVYSWVPPDVQDRILAIFRAALAPFGVGYLSYNALPGWAVRGVVRDVMRDAARGATTDAERLRLAKGRVAELLRHAERPEHPYSALLASELASAQDKPDAYLLGDYLAERNEPVYFKDLIRRAAEHRLAYVCEMIPATAEGALEMEVPAKLIESGMSRIEAEQCLDVLTYRQFRATLLAREEAPIHDEPDDMGLGQRGCFAASLTPLSHEPLLGPGKLLAFRTPSGAEIQATRPLLKTALLVLAEAWPAGLPAQQLFGAALAALRERGLLAAAGIDEEEIQRTAGDLVELSRRRIIELLPWTPEVHRDLAQRPAVRALTRVEAERAPVVTTPRHEPAILAEPVRTLARLLDGTRDLRALVGELSSRIDSGELSLEHPIPAAQRTAALAQVVADAVAEIRDLGLLAAAPRPEGPAAR